MACSISNIYEKVKAANILVITSPIWLGEKSSICTKVIERLYSLQHLGYVIPPQADAAGLGEAGPGPSYLDPGSGSDILFRSLRAAVN